MKVKQPLNPGDLEGFMQENDIPGEIIHLDVPTPTVISAAQAVGTAPENIVKSILFLVGDRTVLTITCGPEFVERRAISAHFNTGRKKVKLAGPDQVLKETGYYIGAMPPFGHLVPLSTLMDKRVLDKRQIYAGGGSDRTLLRIDPQAILTATQAEVLDLLKPPDLNTNNQSG
jgi:prolyl-tRNA editing enzyme YbaK/EbsC (Cys-tRNA(Pro) deacylase)